MIGEPELFAGALVLARLGGLAVLAPALGDEELPARARIGVVVVLTAVLAPLRLDASPAIAALPGALLYELGLGLATGAVARFALIAVEIAGQLTTVSLGFGFAAQYDASQDSSADVGRALARTLALLAFLAAGGLEALVRAAAAPATPFALASTTELALGLATAATTTGLGLAAPLLLAALVGNLAVALAHRAAAAVNIFAVGLAAGTLVVGLAALATSAPLLARVQRLAAIAVDTLATEVAR